MNFYKDRKRHLHYDVVRMKKKKGGGKSKDKKQKENKEEDLILSLKALKQQYIAASKKFLVEPLSQVCGSLDECISQPKKFDKLLLNTNCLSSGHLSAISESFQSTSILNSVYIWDIPISSNLLQLMVN